MIELQQFLLIFFRIHWMWPHDFDFGCDMTVTIWKSSYSFKENSYTKTLYILYILYLIDDKKTVFNYTSTFSLKPDL